MARLTCERQVAASIQARSFPAGVDPGPAIAADFDQVRRWAGERGSEVWEKVPRDEIRHGLSHAKDSIDEVVESELRGLRRAIRRRRKQLGL